MSRRLEATYPELVTLGARISVARRVRTRNMLRTCVSAVLDRAHELQHDPPAVDTDRLSCDERTAGSDEEAYEVGDVLWEPATL